jgi:hypothetical protein
MLTPRLFVLLLLNLGDIALRLGQVNVPIKASDLEFF